MSLVFDLGGPGSRTRDSARKDRAQSRPKVFRVSGSGHIGEGRSGRPVFARERPPFRSSGLRYSRQAAGCLKVSLPIWPLPETPSTGVRPGSVGFPLTDEPSERRFACLLLATSIPAFAFPTGSSRYPLVLHGLCTHGASLGPLTVSGLDGAILRCLLLAMRADVQARGLLHRRDSAAHNRVQKCSGFPAAAIRWRDLFGAPNPPGRARGARGSLLSFPRVKSALRNPPHPYGRCRKP